MLAERWLAATSRIIATLEKDPALLQTKAQPDLGDLALAVGLAYVGFRLSDLNWRKGAPQTAGWFDRINDRRSMQLTEPE